MSNLNNYECDGQMTLTEYMQTLIKQNRVMDLTSFINSKGKAQYTQVEDIITQYVGDTDLADHLTNAISVFILSYSLDYMDYLRKESGAT